MQQRGIYSLAGNVQLVLTVLTDSIATVWSTWFYQKMDANDTKDIQHRAFQLCRMFAALCGHDCHCPGDDLDLGRQTI